MAASRLLHTVRVGDTVSRLDGDEFIMLLSEIQQPEDASLIAEKIIHAVKMPILIYEKDICDTASVGIAAYPSGGEDATTLMKNMDIAMYSANEAGRNGCQFFEKLKFMSEVQKKPAEVSFELILRYFVYTIEAGGGKSIE